MRGSHDHKNLKVLMTADAVGGVWTYCMELCRQLPSVKFHMVTMGAALESFQREEANALPNLTVYETNFLLEWMQQPWESIAIAKQWLLDLEAQLKPDLVHLNNYCFGSLSFDCPSLVVAHSDVYSWWQAVRHSQPTYDWNTYHEAVLDGLLHVNHIVAPSQAALDMLRANFYTTVPCGVIYNGRDAASFYKAQKQPIVFGMGRLWDEAKNIRLLVEAAPSIEWSIRIAGDTAFESDCYFNPCDNLVTLGKLPAALIAQELSVASIYVLPARYEPFGLSVLEAALAGCALVLGDIDSLREIWGDAALYVPVDSVDNLSEAINALIHNPGLLAQYADRAFQRASQYQSQTMAEQYMRLYRNLLQQSSIHQLTGI